VPSGPRVVLLKIDEIPCVSARFQARPVKTVPSRGQINLGLTDFGTDYPHWLENDKIHSHIRVSLMRIRFPPPSLGRILIRPFSF